MRGREALLGVLLSLAFHGSPAFAQVPEPGSPGPYVIDVRGTMSGVPNAQDLLVLEPAVSPVPSVGFGAEVGAHVYPVTIRGSRVGLGFVVRHVRGSAMPAESEEGAVAGGEPSRRVTSRVTTMVPELSLNFGTGDGWSHLAGGVGFGRSTATVEAEGAEVVATSEWGTALSFGGGARWFTSAHMAVGFDIRWMHLQGRGAQTPRGTVPAGSLWLLSIGVSVR